MDKMQIYNAVRWVPEEAKKEIGAGRLKGMTDINPMWRIKTLTEQFGVCGIGWRYEIVKQWTEQGAGSEFAAFCNINLYVKFGEQWSEAIPGTGGAKFVANESKGHYTDDEAYKKALTDAISVACKALGFGADVYWSKDSTKYDERPAPQYPVSEKVSDKDVKIIEQLISETGSDFGKLLLFFRVTHLQDMTKEQAAKCIEMLKSKQK